MLVSFDGMHESVALQVVEQESTGSQSWDELRQILYLSSSRMLVLLTMLECEGCVQSFFLEDRRSHSDKDACKGCTDTLEDLVEYGQPHASRMNSWACVRLIILAFDDNTYSLVGMSW